MKRAERQPWLDIGGYILCCWCRYAVGAGQEDDAEGYCEHPLDVARAILYDNGMEPGVDCWGFRPGKGDTAGLARGRVMDRLEGRCG